MALPPFLCRKDLTPLFNRFLDRLTDSLCIAPNQFRLGRIYDQIIVVSGRRL